MKPRYDSIGKLKLVSGNIYQVSEFVIWYITLPFYMGYDLIYLILKGIANSPSFQLFIKSSFASIIVCSCLFTLLVFAPFPFPLWGVILIKSLLLFALIFPAINGLRQLDLRYFAIEQDQEDKMLHNLRKQVNIGVPDRQAKEELGESVEVLALKVRLAEMEARQRVLEIETQLRERELQLRSQELEMKAQELNSPLYQMKKELEVRKVLVSDLEVTAKEENLGLKERPRDKDLTVEEKKAIGMNLEKQASPKQLKIVRVLEQALIDSKYQPKLFKFEAQRNQAVVEFTVSANKPTLPNDEGFIESLRKQVDSNSVKVIPLNKAMRFVVSSAPYRSYTEVEEKTIEIEGNNDPTVLQIKGTNSDEL